LFVLFVLLVLLVLLVLVLLLPFALFVGLFPFASQAQVDSQPWAVVGVVRACCGDGCGALVHL